MKRYFIILIFFTWTIGVWGQQKKTWTLNGCILYAIQYSPDVNNQKYANDIYHQNYIEAVGRLLPNISANTSAGFNFGRGVDEETNTYINVNSFSNNYGINVSMTLFDGLANYTRVRIGRVNKLKGKNELEDAKDMVAYSTMEAFYNVLYNKDLVASATEQLEESVRSFQQIKRMEELGVKSVPDIVECEAKVAEDTYNLTKQKNLLTISIIQLKEKMNFPLDEELDIQHTDNEQAITKIQEMPFEIYEKSKAFNPKAQIAESDIEYRKLAYKASKGSLAPSISAGVGASTNFFKNMDGSPFSSFSDQFKNKQGEYISLTLSIPVFSGLSRSTSINSAKAQIFIAENNKNDVFRKLFSDIEQAVADANGQVDEHYQAIRQRKSAEIAHQVNLRKYEEGLIDPILLHTSSNRLLKAKAEEYRAKYMYCLKYKLVNYYKGEPFFLEE